jgi:ABC-type nitrate/sulfonate/bicarbonate transport system substrate-binding protein
MDYRFNGFFAALAAAVALTAGCGEKTAPQSRAPSSQPAPSIADMPAAAPVELTVATVGQSVQSAPIYLAMEKGLFKKYGVDLKIVQLDPAASLAALISGSAQIIHAGPNIIDAAVKAPDRVRVISTYGELPMWLYARGDTELKSLKGKTLASTTPGGLVDLAMKTMIMSQGLVPQKDVKILYTGNGAAVLAAVSSGNVDGGVLTPPATFQADDMGLRNVAYLNGLDKVKGKFGVIGVHQPYALKYPQAVEGYIRGYLEGARSIAGDLPAAKAAVLKHTQLPDDKAMQQTFDLYVKHSLWPLDMRLPESEVAFLLKELEPTNPAAKTARPADVLDNRYADAAHKKVP